MFVSTKEFWGKKTKIPKNLSYVRVLVKITSLALKSKHNRRTALNIWRMVLTMLVERVVTPCTSMFLRNVGAYKKSPHGVKPRIPTSPSSPPWEPTLTPTHRRPVPEESDIRWRHIPAVYLFIYCDDWIPGSSNCRQCLNHSVLVIKRIGDLSFPSFNFVANGEGGVSLIIMSHDLQLHPDVGWQSLLLRKLFALNTRGQPNSRQRLTISKRTKSSPLLFAHSH